MVFAMPTISGCQSPSRGTGHFFRLGAGFLAAADLADETSSAAFAPATPPIAPGSEFGAAVFATALFLVVAIPHRRVDVSAAHRPVEPSVGLRADRLVVSGRRILSACCKRCA